MGHARYVGRVGTLAVALGIGAAVLGGPGVAWADDDGEGSSFASSSAPDSGPSSASSSPSSDASGADSSGADASGADVSVSTRWTTATARPAWMARPGKARRRAAKRQGPRRGSRRSSAKTWARIRSGLR